MRKTGEHNANLRKYFMKINCVVLFHVAWNPKWLNIQYSNYYLFICLLVSLRNICQHVKQNVSWSGSLQESDDKPRLETTKIDQNSRWKLEFTGSNVPITHFPMWMPNWTLTMKTIEHPWRNEFGKKHLLNSFLLFPAKKWQHGGFLK